jgi:hypothetical protein
LSWAVFLPLPRSVILGRRSTTMANTVGERDRS